MEALIILFGEFLLLPITAGVSVLGSFVGSIIGIIGQLVFGITPRQKEKEPQPKDPIRIPQKLIKWFCGISLSIFGLLVAGLLVLNVFFLEATIRFAADKAEEHTGIQIDYEFNEGNLFTGYFAFGSVYIENTSQEAGKLKAEINSIEANLPITRLILGSREVESLEVSDAQIEYHLAKKTESETSARRFEIGASVTLEGKPVDGVAVTKRPSLLNTPSYRINELKLDQISVNVVDESSAEPTAYNIEIERCHASPLRSHFAIFDILFRTNLTATLNGSVLEILNTETNGIRTTKWATQDVPAEILASLVGGPFSLFESGSVDFEIHDEWEVKNIENISMEWTIRVRDARATLPEGVPSMLQPVAQVWVNNINSNQQDWEFGFELELSEDRFHGASSLNATQIWKDSVPVVLKQIADFSGIEESAIKDTTGKAFEKFKGFLKDRKKE